MTKLEQLIEQLCPDGVEYKTIGEIAVDIYRGSGIKRNEVTADGVPCVRYGEIYTSYNIWFDSCISHTKLEYVKSPKYFEHGDILFAITGESVEEIAKSIAYIGYEKCLAGGDIVVLKHNQNPKYLSYALSTVDAQKQKSAGKVKSKVVHSSVPAIKAITIPIPPLEVQAEIVRILDTFTELTTKLTTELATELTIRRKQYKYYRDALFRKPNFEAKPITEIADTYIGLVTTMTKHYVSDGVKLIHNSDIKENRFEFKKDVYLDEEFAEKNKSRKHQLDDIITVHTGDVGTSAVIGKELEGSLGFATIVSRIKDKEKVIPKYLCYYLNSYQNKSNIASMIKGDRNNLNLKDFNKLIIPVPPIEEQQRIVNILDRFDKLCNDISEGLPAEIEARQKQYEYYRDKLLTFKERSV